MSITDKKSVVNVSLENFFEKTEEITGFTSMSEFIQYVLIECSNCVMEESCIEEIKQSSLYDKYRDQVKIGCKEIKKSNLTKDFLEKFSNQEKIRKTLLGLKGIELFVKAGLLSLRGNMYYLLDTNRRLSWTNIKQLKMRHLNSLNSSLKKELIEIFGNYDIVLLVKCVFWYFRKAIVDSILYDIIKNVEKKKTRDVVVVSVGSTKLSSDYDISIDSDYNTSGYMINKFTKMIDLVFNDDSESIFDTNVYGVSFTKRDRDDVFTQEHKCDKNDETSIKYMESSLDIEISQMIWGYVKLLLKMSVILKQDDKVYEKLYTYLDDKFEKNVLFQQAINVVNTYKSDVSNYRGIVSKFAEYMDNNKTVGGKDYLIGNFISYVNYNGSETYLTSGAFLDVVINQQMCLNKSQIDLSKPYMYFISYLENMSDLLTHYHKTKYTLRAERALINMNKLLLEEFTKLKTDVIKKKWGVVYKDIIDILKWVIVTQNKCDEDAYKCQVFDLMYMILFSIVNVALIFNEYIDLSYSDIDLKNSIKKFSILKFPEIKQQNMIDLIDSVSPVKQNV